MSAMDQMKNDKDLLLLERPNRRSNGVYLSRCAVLTVILLNVSLLVSCITMAVLLRGTSDEIHHRTVRQAPGDGPGLGPGPEIGNCMEGEECCRLLDPNALKQLCTQLGRSTPPVTTNSFLVTPTPTATRSKRNTPLPTSNITSPGGNSSTTTTTTTTAGNFSTTTINGSMTMTTTFGGNVSSSSATAGNFSTTTTNGSMTMTTTPANNLTTTTTAANFSTTTMNSSLAVMTAFPNNQTTATMYMRTNSPASTNVTTWGNENVTVTWEYPMESYDAVDSLRLPRYVRPYHYDIWWRPDFYNYSSPTDFRFNGSVEIYFRCHSPTSAISVNVRNLTIDLSSIQVKRVQDNVVINWIDTDENTTTEVFRVMLERPLVVDEEIVIEMDFTGNIENGSAGIFWREYNIGNETRYFISTQLETTEARRAFPCVDDPAEKATFTISIDRQPQVFTLSNMPLNYTVIQPGTPTWLTDVFQTTRLPMSTYLVAFVVSDFTGINETSDGINRTPIGLWAQQDYTASGYLNEAAMVGPKCIKYYENFFNFPFVWPKLDMVAEPLLSFGAMENWGLITYRLNYFLFDPEESDTVDKIRAVTTIAHEIFHNWLGNTITIQWWDDLFLTEGMTTYFEFLGTQAAFPTWDVDQLLIDEAFYRKAMWRDDTGSSTPVYNGALKTNTDLDDMFNVFTYYKGASITRMLRELILGEDLFQQAMQNYVHRYQYENVNHDNFFQVLKETYLNSTQSPDFNVSEVLSTWIMQMGYPLVTVTRNSTNTLSFTQKLYLYQPNATLVETYPSPYGYLWEIPITYITNLNSTPTKVWMHKEANMTIQLTGPLMDDDWIIINYNLYGYYRANYDQNNWWMIAEQLTTDHTKIPLMNRAQLIDDSFKLAMSGNLTQVTSLMLTEYLMNETEYLPWDMFMENMVPVLRRFIDNQQIYQRLQNYTLSRLVNIYGILGWDFGVNDNVTVTLLRRLILELACKVNYSQCVNEALSRFRAWQANGFNATWLNPDQRFAVYCTVAANGSYDDWELLFARYQAMTSSFSGESSKLALALTCSRNATSIRSLLEAVQAENMNAGADSDKLVTNLVLYIAQSPQGYNISWDHLYKYGNKTASRADIIKGLSTVISTQAEADRVDAYLRQYPDSSDSENVKLESYRMAIQQNIVWRQSNEKDIEDWLTEGGF